MKKLICAVAILTAVVHTTHARAGINVVTSTEDLASLVREVGGDKVYGRVAREGLPGPALRRGEAQLRPQAAQRRPADRRRPRARDRLAAAAHHAEPQRRRSSLAAPGYLDASLTARILDIPTGQITRAMGDVHPQGNPHYWLDPGNGRRIAKAIQDKLSSMSSGDAAYFAQRYADFDRRLAEGEKRWQAAMAPYKGLKIVTYHRSWPNFAEAFGLDVIGYVEPKPGIPPSPSHPLDAHAGDEGPGRSRSSWSSRTSI